MISDFWIGLIRMASEKPLKKMLTQTSRQCKPEMTQPSCHTIKHISILAASRVTSEVVILMIH